jgi:SAM-dependent methyltransferase
MSEPSHLSQIRTAYDVVAYDYAALLADALAASVFDRAVLGAFAELVLADGGGPVCDLGCGPGRVTAHLASLGLSAFGVDLSPEMVAVARRTYPHLRFERGSISDLAIADGVLAGAAAWYSLIHTPPSLQPSVFAEFHRVLRPAGHLVLAFQVGDDERRHLGLAYGHDIDLDAWRLNPDRVAAQLARAGFERLATMVREPEGPNEKSHQAYLLVRRVNR